MEEDTGYPGTGVSWKGLQNSYDEYATENRDTCGPDRWKDEVLKNALEYIERRIALAVISGALSAAAVTWSADPASSLRANLIKGFGSSTLKIWRRALSTLYLN